MCGVCGIVSPSGAFDAAAARDVVAAMVKALAHRGPDSVGIDAVPGAVLGATRLAIRGIAAGRQPIVDRRTGTVAVCNGEIDNAPELRAWLAGRGAAIEQATDVAIIPALYDALGETFVERIAGAFAIAIWDPAERRLLLARDRAGERPLFYRTASGAIAFATEIAALAADSAAALSPDRDALAGYLRFGSFTAPQTPFSEIRKVSPAEIVTFDPRGVRRRRYWRWDVVRVPKRSGSLDRFDAVFRESVRRQSEADVPFGLFLSGGIDSSLVAATAKALRPQRPLRAYTLRFGESSYDEGAFAETAARALGLDSVSVWVRPDAFPAEIAGLIGMVGEPLADPAWIPTALLARRASEDVKFALVGEGADELFGGYPTYAGIRLAEAYARWPAPLRALSKRLVERWPPSERKVTVSFLLKRFVAASGMEGVARHLLWTSNIAPDLLARLGVIERPEPAPSEAGEILDLVQRHDLETSLAEGLLTKADRASMQSALELRAPFLDQAVMEFAAGLPAAERVRGFTTKVFLKRYAERYLPGAIVRRRKRGLSVPLSGWLRGPLAEWASSRLGDPLLSSAGVDRSAALAILEEHRLRKADHARAVWSLAVLSEWLSWADARVQRPRGDRISDSLSA